MHDISIVIPVYRNAPTLVELTRRLIKTMAQTGQDFEIIFVDDHSPDESLQILRSLAQADSRISALILSENVGQNKALLIGLNWARGNQVACLDADLQDPPEALLDLLAISTKGFPVVFAGRCGQYETADRLFTSRIFKNLMHVICGIPSDAGSYVLMHTSIAHQLTSLYAPVPYLVGMIGCLGNPMASIPVKRSTREQGNSAYSSLKRFKIGINAVWWVFAWKYWYVPQLKRNLNLTEKIVSPVSTSTESASSRIQEFIGDRFYAKEIADATTTN